MSKKSLIIIVIAICSALIGCIIAVSLLTAGVNITTEDDKIIFKATSTDTTEILYSEIDTITTVSDIDLGKRTNGISTSKISAGHYNNELYNDYMLYSFNDVKTYIVVLSNDKYYVFNENTIEDTINLFEEIEAKL